MNLWEKLRKEFDHAFALTPSRTQMSEDELELLKTIADVIVKRGMAEPALLLLESSGPLNFLASQLVHGLKPFLDVVCRPTDLDRLALILERRNSVDWLISLIQEQANSPV